MGRFSRGRRRVFHVCLIGGETWLGEGNTALRAAGRGLRLRSSPRPRALAPRPAERARVRPAPSGRRRSRRPSPASQSSQACLVPAVQGFLSSKCSFFLPSLGHNKDMLLIPEGNVPDLTREEVIFLILWNFYICYWLQ